MLSKITTSIFVSSHALFLLFVLSFLLTGCEKDYKELHPATIIWDDEQILAQETKIKLDNVNFPKGIAVAVRTLYSLQPEETIGMQADVLFTSDTKQHPNSKSFKDRGVYILVSEFPRLIQVRVGDELYLPALSSGVIAGTKYIQIQKIAIQGDLDVAVQRMTDLLIVELPKILERKERFSGIIKEAATYISKEIEQISFPSDDFFGRLILKPFIELRIIELRLLNTYWVSYIVAGIVLVLLKLFFDLVTAPFLSIAKPVVIIARILFSIAVGIAVGLGSAASAILLAGARIEDILALQYLKIDGLSSLTLNPELYLKPTSIWLAIILAILRVGRGFAGRSNLVEYAVLPAEQQRRIFASLQENSPFRAFILQIVTANSQEIGPPGVEFGDKPFTTAYLNPGADDIFAALRWFLLAWFLLPKALSLAALCIWLLPTINGGLISIYRWHKAKRSIVR